MWERAPCCERWPEFGRSVAAKSRSAKGECFSSRNGLIYRSALSPAHCSLTATRPKWLTRPYTAIVRFPIQFPLPSNGNIRTAILVNEVVMNYWNTHSWSVNVDRRIALALRKDLRLLGVFERRLRSKMASARSAATVGNDDWEWYVILTCGRLCRSSNC